MFTKNLKLTMVLALTVMFVSVAKVGAATITVSGTCSLDDAITSSNTNTATGGCVAGSGVDTISLPSATMTISSTPVEFTESVNIVGQGSGATVLDSSHQNGYAFSNRSTQNPNVNLEVSGITFRNFGLINGSSELRVIDISSSGGNLKVSDVRFEDTVASNPVRATSFINSLINIGNLNSLEITDSHVDNTVINLDQGGNRASIVMVSSYDPVTQAFNFGAQTITINGFNATGTSLTAPNTTSQEVSAFGLSFLAGEMTINNYSMNNNNLTGDADRISLFGALLRTQVKTNINRYSFNNNSIVSSSPASSGNIVGLAYDTTINSTESLLKDINIDSNDFNIPSATLTDASRSGFYGIQGYVNGDTAPNPINSSVVNYSFTNNTATTGDFPDSQVPRYASLIAEVDGNARLNLVNSTISNNQGVGSIGAYFSNLTPDTGLFVANSTIADNTYELANVPNIFGGIGIVQRLPIGNESSIIELKNTILHNNTIGNVPDNCGFYGTTSEFTSTGGNISNDDTCVNELVSTGDHSN